MKELSIEEKAKAYDEAIERAREIHNEQKAQPFNVMLKVFPELKESEDERIIKIIKNCLTQYNCGVVVGSLNAIDYADSIAWLEKQGEYANFRNKIQIGDKVTRNEDGVLVNMSQLKRVAKPAEEYNITGIGSKHAEGKLGEMIKKKLEMEKQNEQKPTELPKGEDYGIDGLYAAIDILQKTLGKVDGYQSDDGILAHKCAISAVKELSKQNPAWSEEDEVALGDALWCCKQAASIAKDENDMGNVWYAENWLKTIKDKVQPQKEWSEKDESMRTRCIGALGKCYMGVLPEKVEEELNWLKSLKDRYTWKPSDEQMDALWDSIKHNLHLHPILKSLYNDLKKLRDDKD